ncbi:4-coumarate--CoA ligase-like [Portunus trituberculatus]|uniref:4-coumarate--CoA ligase-like n=1 Tax=Portunus trituberculatus TaxID=210409 RepID=UPI001E1D0552|nr:4-coumarate--CoA ligase-like [Portunus trituberculatus]XP_045131853.1 4-coumarate--CoA ligase-like [Portunus trituberculatus]
MFPQYQIWACAQVSGLVLRRRVGSWVWHTSSRKPNFMGWHVAKEADVSGLRHHSSTAEYIVSSAFPDIPLPTGNIATYLLETTKQWQTKIALECAVTGRNYTYGQVVDAVARWGGYLAMLGMQKGDRMAIMMLNYPEYILVMLGAISVGIPVTVINSSYTAEEVCHQLKDSDASLVVHDDATEKVIEAALTLLKKPLRRVINTDASPPAGIPSLRSLLQDSSLHLADPIEVSGTETALLPYSSGTTGKPKGVETSHNALSSNTEIYTHPNFFTSKSPTECHQDVFLCYLPLFHVYGILPIMMVALHTGVKVVTVPKFDIKAFVPLIVKHKVEMVHTVPPVLNFMIQSPDVNSESMKYVKTLLCGAAPVPQPSVKILQEKTDRSLFFQEGYGMTEVLISHITPTGFNHAPLCILPNVKCKVIDVETGKSLPANAKGEICLKSPSMMTGYLNNETATRATIDEDGWVHSGDIGYYDDSESFNIVDRIKELIKVKAMQVAPSELEEVLLQHPKVKEVGVTGVPHDRFGEAPRAYVVTSTPTSEKEIHEFMTSHVAPYKQLAGGVVFVSELPKTASGKILRRALREL